MRLELTCSQALALLVWGKHFSVAQSAACNFLHAKAEHRVREQEL